MLPKSATLRNKSLRHWWVKSSSFPCQGLVRCIFISVECFLCSAYCVHSLLLRQIFIQACHIHWNKYNVFYDFCCCAIGWSCLIHPDIIVLPTSVSLWRCKMVEFNTDFLFLTKPFVLVTMGDALLSWEFTFTSRSLLRFLSVSCFNPLHTKGGGVYFTQK